MQKGKVVMAFEPIVNERLSDKVVQMIMNQIQEGGLKPGEKLPNELEFAETLHVSRGVIREAMTMLQARGFVLRKQKEGTFVNPDILALLKGPVGISLKQATYLDMLEMRECIEQREVENVIRKATDEQVAELEELVISGETKDTGRTSVDYYFHYHLAELSQNAMFANFIDSYYDIIDEVKARTTVQKSRKEEIINEHMAIVSAIKERNIEKAKAAVVFHLSRVRAKITEDVLL